VELFVLLATIGQLGGLLAGWVGSRAVNSGVVDEPSYSGERAFSM